MRFDAVIFDIDNVLVDTRASYTDCIRKTVETYLTSLGFRPSRKPLLSRRDVEAFKSLGGFNDDWDTCYGLLLYFLSLKIQRKTINDLWKQKNIAGLKNVGASPRGRPHNKGRHRGLPLHSTGPKRAEKWFGKNPSVTIQKIAEIFQRFYLNEFMWNEKLLIPRSFLKTLKRAGLKVGIVTGRNREEAQFALRRFQIDSFIDAMITIDETPKPFKKPDPWGLLKIAAKLGKNLRYLYVGDLPDDVLAARRAKQKMKISSVGYLAASEFPKEMARELKKAGADFVCGKPKELMKIISPIRR